MARMHSPNDQPNDDEEEDDADDDINVSMEYEEDYVSEDDQKVNIFASPVGMRKIPPGTSFSVPHHYADEPAKMAKLIKIFQDSGCPENLYDKAMNEVQSLVLDNVITKCKSNIPSYAATLKALEKDFPVVPPIQRTIEIELPFPLEDGKVPTVSFPTFSFVDTLQDLLNSPVFEDENNFDFHSLCPFGRGEEDLSEEKEDVNSNDGDESDESDHQEEEEGSVVVHLVDPRTLQDGTRFKEAVQNLAAKFGEDSVIAKWLSLGLQFFVDKISSMDRMQVYGMEPLMYTLSCFTEEQRRNPANWRCLGYIPKLPKGSMQVGEENRNIPMGYHLRNYHKVMDVLLEGVVAAQKVPPTLRMRVGSEYKWGKGHIHVNNMIADGLAIDVVSGRCQTYKNSPRICVSCHTRQKDANCTGNMKCKFLTQWGIEKMVIAALGPEDNNNGDSEFSRALSALCLTQKGTARQKSALSLRMKIVQTILHRVFSQHVVDNAFFKVLFDDPCGIFGLRFTEIMHCLEEGLYPYILKAFLGPLSIATKNKLDKLAKLIVNQSRPGMRDQYPEINLTKGFCNLSTLSADRRVGRVFLLMIIAETPAGRALLQKRCDKNFDAERLKRSVGKKRKNDDVALEESKDDEDSNEEEEEENVSDDEEAAVDEDNDKYLEKEEEDEEILHDELEDKVDSDNEEEEEEYITSNPGRQPRRRKNESGTTVFLPEDKEYAADELSDREVEELTSKCHSKQNLVHLVLRELGLSFLSGFMQAMEAKHNILCHEIVWEKIRNKVYWVPHDDTYEYTGPFLHRELHPHANRRSFCFSKSVSQMKGEQRGGEGEVNGEEESSSQEDSSEEIKSSNDDSKPAAVDVDTKITSDQPYDYPKSKDTIYYDSIYSPNGAAFGLDHIYNCNDDDEESDADDEEGSEEEDDYPYQDAFDEEDMFDYVTPQNARHSFDGDIDDLRILCWRVLSFHALMNYNGVDTQSGLRLLLVRIDELIDTLNRRIDRGEGTIGWALQKCHELRHIVLDWIQIGHSINVNAGKCEAGLKSWGKDIARNAKKSGNERFTKSAAVKLKDRKLIEKVAFVMEEQQQPITNQDNHREEEHIELGGRRLQIEEDGWRCDYTVKEGTNTLNFLDPTVETYMRKEFGNGIKLYSEAYLPTEKPGEPIVVRGTGEYRRDVGEWYDWVDVSYAQTTNLGRTAYEKRYPFQVRGFFIHPETMKMSAVGYCGLEQTPNEMLASSGLIEHWRMEDDLRVVACESIVQLRFGFFLPAKAMETVASHTNRRLRRQAYILKDRQEDWGIHFMKGWKKERIAKQQDQQRKKQRRTK